MHSQVGGMRIRKSMFCDRPGSTFRLSRAQCPSWTGFWLRYWPSKNHGDRYESTKTWEQAGVEILYLRRHSGPGPQLTESRQSVSVSRRSLGGSATVPGAMEIRISLSLPIARATTSDENGSDSRWFEPAQSWRYTATAARVSGLTSSADYSLG